LFINIFKVSSALYFVNNSKPLVPYSRLARDCVAIAPTFALTQGTKAPTAKNLLATPTTHASSLGS